VGINEFLKDKFEKAVLLTMLKETHVFAMSSITSSTSSLAVAFYWKEERLRNRGQSSGTKPLIGIEGA
jgi:hypothetical protein